MARIDRSPDVQEYVREVSLSEIDSRGGIVDLFQQGHVILVCDYRPPVNFDAIGALDWDLDRVADPKLRHRIKKLTTGAFLEEGPPVRHTCFQKRRFSSPVKDPLRQTVFEVLCGVMLRCSMPYRRRSGSRRKN